LFTDELDRDREVEDGAKEDKGQQHDERSLHGMALSLYIGYRQKGPKLSGLLVVASPQ